MLFLAVASEPSSAAIMNITHSNFKSFAQRHDAVLYLFTAPWCTHCHDLQPEYEALLPLLPQLIPLARIDAGADKGLMDRFDVIDNLPALVLHRKGKRGKTREIKYQGEHKAPRIAAFVSDQMGDAMATLSSAAELTAFLGQSAAGKGTLEVRVVAFFSSAEDEEMDDFKEAAEAAQDKRGDIPMRWGVSTSAELLKAHQGPQGWFWSTPAVALFLGTASPLPHVRTLELDASTEPILQWVEANCIPPVQQLTPLNFEMYASLKLPMLLLFLRPPSTSKQNRRLVAELEKAASHFPKALTFVWVDGVKYQDRLLSLGLPASKLPALAINSMDQQRYPYPHHKGITATKIREFCKQFLMDKLRPLPPNEGAASPGPGAPSPQKDTPWGPISTGNIVELSDSSWGEVTGSSVHEVMVLLYKSVGCEDCESLTKYYQRVAGRFEELNMTSVVISQLDVSTNAVPPHVTVDRLPMIIMLPAKSKHPPYITFIGVAKPKQLMEFVQSHASSPLTLPVNPHLTREQHKAWLVQTAELRERKAKQAKEAEEKEQKEEL